MFRQKVSDTGTVLPYEYMEAADGTYHVGQALTVVDGKLTAIVDARATTPEYICEAEKTVVAGGELPVTRVSKSNIYETTLAAGAADAKVGSKVQVAAGGTQVEYTDGNTGTFELVSLAGNAEGDKVRGRWL